MARTELGALLCRKRLCVKGPEAAPRQPPEQQRAVLLHAINTDLLHATLPVEMYTQVSKYDDLSADESASLCIRTLQATSPAHALCAYCHAVKDGRYHTCNGWHIARLQEAGSSCMCLCYSELSLLRNDYVFEPRVRTAIVKTDRLLEGVLNGLEFLAQAVHMEKIPDNSAKLPFPVTGRFKLSPMSLNSIFKHYSEDLIPNSGIVRNFQEHSAESALHNISYMVTRTRGQDGLLADIG